MTSHFEAYIFTIQEQEIEIKDLIRQKMGAETDNRCRLCKNHTEDLFHAMIISCSRISSRYYLPLTHDDLPRYVHDQHHVKLKSGCKVEYPSVEFVHSEDNIEYWWNLLIKATIETKNNKADMIIWNSEVKTCQIVNNLVVPQTLIFPRKFLKKRIYTELKSTVCSCFRQIKNLSSFQSL